jgi:hypothetical protein
LPLSIISLVFTKPAIPLKDWRSLGAFTYDDHNFKDYVIIYGHAWTRKQYLHDYYYSLEEIAELFEGKLKGKIVHFSNKKSFRLNCRRSTILLDTHARAISGYGESLHTLSSIHLDKAF